MPPLVQLLQDAWDVWPPVAETAIFGVANAEDIAGALTDFVRRHAGPVGDAVFYKAGVGLVAGMRLIDGRAVVIKVHRWQVSLDRLTAVQRVQAHLADAGLPAPRPLAPPAAFEGGIATVEELLTRGTPSRDRRVLSRSLAGALHRFVVAAPSPAAVPALGSPLLLRTDDEPLWWEPHDLRFDFDATSAGAEWIDELAREARRRLRGRRGAPVVGHFDWRVENLGLAATEVIAIYDWDSVFIAPEAVIVGNSAGAYTSDWTVTGEDTLPTLDDMRTFIADYEAARGRPFSAGERELLDAANLALCTYGARCQHSDLSLHPELGGSAERLWLRLLRERGERGLLPESADHTSQ